MNELILLAVIICLIGLIGWDRYESKKERAGLMRMFISKNATELRDLEAIEKIQVKANLPLEHQPDEIPVEQMTDEQFDEKIKEAIANG